jgi:hypothetical protein
MHAMDRGSLLLSTVRYSARYAASTACNRGSAVCACGGVFGQIVGNPEGIHMAVKSLALIGNGSAAADRAKTCRDAEVFSIRRLEGSRWRLRRRGSYGDSVPLWYPGAQRWLLAGGGIFAEASGNVGGFAVSRPQRGWPSRVEGTRRWLGTRVR